MDARNVLFAKGTFGDPIHRRGQYDQLEQEILENPQLKDHEFWLVALRSATYDQNL